MMSTGTARRRLDVSDLAAHGRTRQQLSEAQRRIDLHHRASNMLRVPKPERNLVPDPATRPTRIVLAGQLLIAALLLASFASGILVWWGKHLQLENSETPPWLHSTIIVHGSLNPVLCVLFGWLLCHHIRVGWQMRANLVSGFVMEATFAGMIITGAGLYYVGDEDWRERMSIAHRVCGVLLPAGLAWHWLAGLAWGRKAAQA